MLKVYGISNCDTVKKALAWLKEHQLAYEFHDYKKVGITPQKLNEWLTQVPHQTLINRAGTTFKKLSEEEKSMIVDNASAVSLMLERTSVIKRPIIESKHILLVGFKPEEYQNTLI